MKVFVLEYDSVHKGVKEHDIVAVCDSLDKAKNIMNTDFHDTIVNLYDQENIAYKTTQEDLSYSIEEDYPWSEHYDKWEISEHDLI